MTQSAATAFAPASMGNVGVGFDILGLSVSALGDQVTLHRRSDRQVLIQRVSGVVTELPREAAKNTAGKALESMVAELGLGFGFDVEIDKGIPLGSGLGGSAASAVAAVVAASALLPAPLGDLELLRFAAEGEAVASGSVHLDNIAPSLFGGLILTVGLDHPRIKRIPVPSGLRAVIVHPHLVLSTKEARRILKKTVELSDVVWQTANLAGFLAACYTNDLPLLKEAFMDVMIEPQRQVLIPGFQAVKAAALSAGALGATIAGAGPTVFAFALEDSASAVQAGMVAAFAAHGLLSDAWISPLDQEGARLLP